MILKIIFNINKIPNTASDNKYYVALFIYFPVCHIVILSFHL